ncbi:TSUP family transporter [Chromobacterium amazonense]|uniref:TSUP family transporter n=1 Tax=Chromobacterium amazonense TaxID=1382803 RepID=UPI003F78DE94
MLLMLALGMLLGAILGLTGAGGGILAIPALMAAQGWSLPQAAPVALLAVVAGAALGARLAQQLSSAWLAGLFALAMLTVAARTWRAAHPEAILSQKPRQTLCRLNPDTGRLRWNVLSAAALAGVGAFTGLLTGLLGVGGGFVIVPALRRLSDLGMQAIIATSLLVIALVGSGGVVSALWHGARPPLPLSAGFVLAAMAGMLLGRRLSRRLSPQQLLRGFALLVAAIGVAMLWRAVAITL